NGVIVITTKRGRAGKPVVAFHTELGRIEDRNDYPASYALLGHSPGSTTPKRCFTYDVAEGSCIVDTETSLNLWKNPATTTIKYGSRRLIGGQVSGGSEQVRYFFSADMNEETGPVGLPAVDRHRFDSLGVVIRSNMLHPNNLKQLSLRSNVDVTFNPRLFVSVSAGLTSLNQRFPLSENGNIASYVQAMTFGPGYASGPGYSGIGANGETLYGYSGMTPGEIFQYVSTQNVLRFVGSTTANWNPLGWLKVKADVGYDMANQDDYTLQRYGEGPTGGTNLLGAASDTRTTHTTFTSNVGATATWQLKPWAQLRSTLGAQYVINARNITSARGTQLVPGGELPSQGTIFAVTASNVPSKTLGEFIEEQLALRERLYFTAAIRSDKNSAFGVNYAGVYYPKASVSWIASEEPFFPRVRYLDELRLRTSFGASGVQPGATAALRTYSSATVTFGGAAAAGLAVANPGNPNLRPERTSEVEAGLDAKLLGGRVNLELTYYKKNTRDALINQPVAPSAGVASYLANLGGVQNAGVEYNLRAQIIDRREIGWDVSYAGSVNNNKVVSIGSLVAAPYTNPQIGYPLASAWGRIITYDDANKDGLLARSEVTITPAATQGYLGTYNPPRQVAVSSGVELLNHRLRLSALVDRRAGGRVLNLEAALPCLVALGCADLQQLHATLSSQARGIAVKQGLTSAYNEDMTFTRLREVSASYALDDALVRRLLGGSSARFTLAARNVALWKKSYTGTDPESTYGSSADLGSAAAQNVATTAPPMYFMLRFNITY
ncbi:MAG: TonB-dependent receptor, partial [Gemmatimonadetes bacterium]|nr:TonB-dependent receptor [Gemmatimonadota bacterium]